MATIHDIEITDDRAVMAERISTMFQEVIREVSTVYMHEGRTEDAVSISHHALSVLMAYCATISVHVIRRKEEDGAGMTRIEAARRFITLVVSATDEIVSNALAEVEKLEAEERLRFVQPEGEA